MTKKLAVCLFLTTVLGGGRAFAVVEDAQSVGDQSNLRPPAALLLSGSSAWSTLSNDGISFLGKLTLPQPTTFAAGVNPLVTQVTEYFQQATGARDGLELKLLEVPQPGSEARLSFVQTVHGVPITGTFAMAQVQAGALHYAQAYLVQPPRLATKAAVSAAAATPTALANAHSFAKSATLAPTPAELVIVYVGDAAHLAWQIDVSTEVPYASWQMFVDARTGAYLTRHKTSQNAVKGTINGEIEPACQGDAPKKVALPHIKWNTNSFTDASGNFESADALSNAQVSLHGRYFNVVSLSTIGKSWSLPLKASPELNDVTLNKADAPFGLLDPYVHANTVRTWATSRLTTMKGAAVEKALAWTEKTVPVIVNISLQKCNAAYIPMFQTLTFFAGQEGKCNNASQIAKVVYHEYGHGIHHHLTAAMGAFDVQVSEGAGDYVASTITNDPAMTGLLACKDTLPTRNKAVMRTCSNHYTYCSDKSKCDTYPKDEPHTAAPIVCGAWWDLRTALSTRYGATEGVAKADALFLKFLTLATTMDKVYTAAIAADDDDDGDPSNGTNHSCEINQAFIGGESDGFAHFPDSIAQKVPCKA